MPKIVASAIKKDGVIYTGRRHHNIIQDNIPIVFKGDNCTQGFVTDTGRFLNRYEAAELVNVNGQQLTDGIEKPVYMLMSEDLW